MRWTIYGLSSPGRVIYQAAQIPGGHLSHISEQCKDEPDFSYLASRGCVHSTASSIILMICLRLSAGTVASSLAT